MMKKNILVYTIQGGGVNKFRVVDPHVNLAELSTDFDVHFAEPHTIGNNNDAQYDLVFLHSSLASNKAIFDKIQHLQKNTKTIVDVDDYWEFPYTHPLFRHPEVSNIKKWITTTIQNATLVTTTTLMLKQKIARLNKNVVVLENSLNPTEKQFTPNPTQSNSTRFGYLGGSTHLHDMDELDGLFTSMQKLKNTQLVLCGFDDRIMDVKTGMITEDALNSTWYSVEKKITDNYNFGKNCLLFKEKLLTFAKDLNEVDKPYRRVWTKNISNYGESYNMFDVSLIPLKDNTFNNCKSELKLIEAAAQKKAVIISNVVPYRKHIIHGENGLIAFKDKDWKTHVKFLSENPTEIRRLGENLNKSIFETFDYKKISAKRAEHYLTL